MIIHRCHGAARQVNSSYHLIVCNDRRVPIDCSVFHDSDKVERANARQSGNGSEPGHD
ncbi:MAG: hypothetical protein ABI767_14605 [Rhodanobacter sp.]